MRRILSNPPNPWLSTHVEWLEEPRAAELEVHEEEARSILARNDSPDVGFTWSVNPYRGCWHACAYCYARPSHQYLGFGAGTDFDRRIVVKRNAAELLARELGRRGWKRETIAFSGNTDCYQPLEASYGLTRRCLEACLERANPVAVITKSVLVRRDADVLAALARVATVSVSITIPFADEAVARAIEPGAPSPAKRFEALRALSEAGVPTAIGIAPVIPGLNDADLSALLARAAACGAKRAFLTLVRLPLEVLPVFEERVTAAFPDRAKKILSAIRETRGGRMNVPQFHRRMHGVGARWEAIERMFEIQCRRHGLNQGENGDDVAPGRGPVQGELFA